MKFNVPTGKTIRVFTTTNLCVTGEFSGVSNDTLSMKDCAVKTPKEKYNSLGAFIKIEHIEKYQILKFINNKFTFSDLQLSRSQKIENNIGINNTVGMKVSDLLKSWSFISERVQRYNGKLTFCLPDTNKKITFSLARVPKSILKADVINFYTYRNDAMIIIRTEF